MAKKSTGIRTKHTSNAAKNKAEPTAGDPPAGSYEVGYGRPPTWTQFRRGQSGNPNGRPKGASQRIGSIAQAALERKIAVDKKGTKRKASVRQVAFERIGEKALAGDIQSVNFLLARESEEQPAAAEQWAVRPELAYEIVDAYFKRQQTKKRHKA